MEFQVSGFKFQVQLEAEKTAIALAKSATPNWPW
jgi:hypothetical protein